MARMASVVLLVLVFPACSPTAASPARDAVSTPPVVAVQSSPAGRSALRVVRDDLVSDAVVSGAVEPVGPETQMIGLAAITRSLSGEWATPAVLTWDVAKGQVVEIQEFPELPTFVTSLAAARVGSGDHARYVLLAGMGTWDAGAPVYLGVGDSSGGLVDGYAQVTEVGGGPAVASEGRVTVLAWLDLESAVATVVFATVSLPNGGIVSRLAVPLSEGLMLESFQAASLVVVDRRVYIALESPGSVRIGEYDENLRATGREVDLSPVASGVEWTGTPLGLLARSSTDIVVGMPDSIRFLAPSLELRSSVRTPVRYVAGGVAVGSGGVVATADGLCGDKAGIHRCFAAEPRADTWRHCRPHPRRTIYALRGQFVQVTACGSTARILVLR